MRSCCSHPERVSSGGLNEGGQCMAPTPQHIPEPVHPPTPERDAVLGLGEKRAHAWRCSGGTCIGRGCGGGEEDTFSCYPLRA